jgi:hypothetical protein
MSSSSPSHAPPSPSNFLHTVREFIMGNCLKSSTSDDVSLLREAGTIHQSTSGSNPGGGVAGGVVGGDGGGGAAENMDHHHVVGGGGYASVQVRNIFWHSPTFNYIWTPFRAA